MVYMLFWIIFGGLVGLIAAILKGDMQLTLRTYLVSCTGAVGGLLGGLLGLRLSNNSASYDALADGLVFAVMGALVLTIATPYLYDKYCAAVSSSKQPATRGAKHQSD